MYIYRTASPNPSSRNVGVISNTVGGPSRRPASPTASTASGVRSPASHA